MHRNDVGIYPRNMRVFYFVDVLRAMWFITSIWVIYERQYLTLSQLTFIEAITVGTTLLLQLPTGAFADLFGRKTAMVIGGLLYSSSLIVYSFATGFPMFMFYAILIGIAQACIDGTREALLYDTLKQDHKEHQFAKTSSKLSMIFQISLAGATLVGGVIGLYSYTVAIWLSAGMFLLTSFACTFFIEPKVDTEKFSLRNYMFKTKQGIQELIKNSYVKKISLYYIMIGSLTWLCVYSFNIMLLSELQYTTSEIGFAVGAGRIFNSIVLFQLLRIGTFFTRKRTFILLPVILIVAYVPVVFISKWWAILPVMGAMIVSGARWNILAHYTNMEFDSKNRATAISTLCMVVGLIYVLVMSISGYVMERFGGIRIIYTMLGIVALVTALPLGIHLSSIHKNDPVK